MGSLDKATMCGFICRLCSEMHRVVIHVYGEEGTRLCIAKKISRYLTINITPADPLPKTICYSCFERLEDQHQLIVVMHKTTNSIRKHQITQGEFDN